MLDANAGTEMYMWAEFNADGEGRMMSHRDGEIHTTGWEDAETVREQLPLFVKIATLSGVTVHETSPDGYGETEPYVNVVGTGNTFRVQVSTDNGRSWEDRPGVYSAHGFGSVNDACDAAVADGKVLKRLGYMARVTASAF